MKLQKTSFNWVILNNDYTMKANSKAEPRTKQKKINLFEETRLATTKGIEDIASTFENSKKINELLIRKGILLAEISIRQNEIRDIDKKLEDTIKKNPINEFISKISTEFEKIEPAELPQLLEALKPLSNLFDLSKLLATQKSKEISDTVTSTLKNKKQKKKK